MGLSHRGGGQDTTESIALGEAHWPTRYALIDSSEQNGTDWMISLFFELAADKVIEVSDAIDRLVGIRRRGLLTPFGTDENEDVIK